MLPPPPECSRPSRPSSPRLCHLLRAFHIREAEPHAAQLAESLLPPVRGQASQPRSRETRISSQREVDREWAEKFGLKTP